MNNKLSSMVFIFTFTAVILGGVLGYFAPEFMLSISFIGKLFFNILKIITIPFAITLIIVGLASMGSKEKVKRSLGKTALYFTATSLTASLVGALITLGIHPGVQSLKAKAFISDDIVPYVSSFSFTNLLGDMIPSNFLSGTIEMQFLAIVIIALIFGTLFTTIDKKDKIVLDFFISCKQLLSSFMKIILYIAPIGLFSLSGSLFAENWQQTELLFDSLLMFTLTIILGLSFFAFVILPIIAKMFSNISPYSYFTSLIPALTTAFATNSAVASLPITEECIKTTTLEQRATAFVLPLGALFNASGTALFLSASTIFIAQVYGVSLGFLQILAVIGGSFIVASVASFIPYASLFMIAIVLEIANFPVSMIAGIGIILLVDFLFGRLRSVVDVWSDAIGVAVIGNTFDFKTARSAKAAIPIKRTYDKSKPRSSRDTYKNKNDYPKTKRENKYSSQTKKPYDKNTKVTNKKNDAPKETISPFNISAKTDYFAETEKSKVRPKLSKSTERAKPEQKKQKTPIVIHDIKVPELPNIESKKETPKVEKTTSSVPATPTKPKPIIHKIEVPPLMALPKTPPVSTTEIQTEKPTDDIAVTAKTTAILSKGTIERERAKIAAQLNLMREKETLQNPSEETIDSKEDQFATIDFYSEENPPSTIKDIAPSQPEKVLSPVTTETVLAEKTVAIIEEPTDEPEAVATNDVSFGRSSSKRTLSKKSMNKSETTISEPPVVLEKSDFTVDSMSFGRSKRKK